MNKNLPKNIAENALLVAEKFWGYICCIRVFYKNNSPLKVVSLPINLYQNGNLAKWLTRKTVNLIGNCRWFESNNFP